MHQTRAHGAKKILSLPYADIKSNTEIYDRYYEVYRMEDGWLPGNKEKNYQEMLFLPEYAGVPLKGTSCLDIGCGTGDFSKWLRDRGIARYTGIDIYEPSLEKARFKYPKEKFMNRDVLSKPLHQQFHYAFCSGSLSTRLSIDNYAFFDSMISALWNSVTVGLVFNILTDTEPFPADYIFYYSEKRINSICSTIVGDNTIMVRHLPHDHQIHMSLYRKRWGAKNVLYPSQS